MNCTRVLQVLSPGSGGVRSPMAPVDMAVICLASSPPVRSFLSKSCSSSARSRRLRPCLSSGRCGDAHCGGVATVTTAPTTATGSAWLRQKKKKNVVFADARGLALAAVHVFNEAEDEPPELQFNLTQIEGATAGLILQDCKDCGPALVLNFPQPAADYLDLRNRLKAQHVCLETCSVQDRLLSGSVQVRNLCFHKSVSVRVTFDSWTSFQDVPCLYLNNVYGCPDTDTFSFSILVPEVLEPSSRVEFCIRYQTRDHTFWDNNDGNNYQLVVSDSSSSTRQAGDSPAGLTIQRDKRDQMDFDPFGSPRTSAGIFPEWQSWGHVETSTPYW